MIFALSWSIVLFAKKSLGENMSKSVNHNWFTNPPSHQLPPPLSPDHVIRGRIPSALADLDVIHRSHQWVPSSHQIRPPDDEKARKATEIELIISKWPSLKDFVVCEIFDAHVGDQDQLPEWMFKPCPFKYNLAEYSNHYVLWNTRHDFNYFGLDEACINAVLTTEITRLLLRLPSSSTPHETTPRETTRLEFDFAWYKV